MDITPPSSPDIKENGSLDEDTLAANRAKLAKKMQMKKKGPEVK